MASPTDKMIAHDLRDVVVRLYRRLHKEISNPEQLSVAEQNVMYQLTQQQELLPSELGARLNISSQYMSQVLNRLETIGYIQRTASPLDKRKTLVSLTNEGHLKVKQSRKEREEWIAGVISKHYSTADKEIIRKAITLLATLPDQ